MLCPECKKYAVVLDRHGELMPNFTDILFRCVECKTRFYTRIKPDALIKIDDD